MNMSDLPFLGLPLRATASGALWWPDADLLVVSDLHLSKSDRLARRRSLLLPPYETRETLARLAEVLQATGARRVICLGDSFDDDAGPQAMVAADAACLAQLQAGRDWIWISGNHDTQPPGLPGKAMAEMREGPLCFRHIAQAGATVGEVSGHYHPKHSLTTRAGRITRPAFLWDSLRLMLPAFGAYTGGLSSADPALRALFGDGAKATLTGPNPVCVPIAQTKARPKHSPAVPPVQRRGDSCG